MHNFIRQAKRSTNSADLHGDEVVEVAVRECVGMQKPDYYRDRAVTVMPVWDRCIDVLGDCDIDTSM